MNRAAYRSLLIRTARRGLIWLIILLGVIGLKVPYEKPAEQPYFWLLTVVTFCLTTLTYEAYAHWLFSRYLYRDRWLPFALASAGLFAAIHGFMYLSYPLLQQTAQIPEQSITKLTHPQLNYWFAVHQAGVFGWLRDPKIVGIVLGTPYFLASPFLFIQLFRHYLAQREHTQQAELDNLSLSSENKRLELDLLKVQLNPHFLFNSLNSIYVRIVDVDDRAADLILRLAELMRYNLYEADAPTVDLDQELGYIENYLQLEQTRHGQRVEIVFSSDGSFSGLVIAPLILLAFVENAFKHGVGGTQQGAYVWVEAHLEQSATLIFTVQNSLANLTKRTGQARTLTEEKLPSVRQRLAFLYPDAHQIDTELSADSYSVSLSLRLTQPV